VSQARYAGRNDSNTIAYRCTRRCADGYTYYAPNHNIEFGIQRIIKFCGIKRDLIGGGTQAVAGQSCWPHNLHGLPCQWRWTKITGGSRRTNRCDMHGVPQVKRLNRNQVSTRNLVST